MKNATLPSDDPLRFRKDLLKIAAGERNNTINNEIEQIKARYKLDWQTDFCFIISI